MLKGHPLSLSCFTAMLQDVSYPGHPLSAPEGSEPSEPPNRPARPQASGPGRKSDILSLGPAPGLVWCPVSGHIFLAGQPLPGEAEVLLLRLWEGAVSSRASCHPAECFPGYLSKLLQNHTAYACDGDHLTLQCPRHSTISVQSAFYGQDYRACSAQQPAAQSEDSLTCVAPTTFQVLRFSGVCEEERVLPVSLSLSKPA